MQPQHEEPGAAAREGTEQASARFEASFRMLIESLPDGVLVHRDGLIVYANPTATHLLGYDEDGMVGHPLVELSHPDERPIMYQRLAEIAGSTSMAPVREARVVRRDGTIITVEVTGLAVTFDGLPAIVSLMHDVTEKRQLLAQLAQRDRLASMGLLAASVAHEINNPITYVLLNLERLVKELPQASRALAELREDLAATLGDAQAAVIFERTSAGRAAASLEMLAERASTAAEGARQVGRIARDLRAFARVDEDERVEVDVNALLDKVIDLAANELRFRATVVREYGQIPSVVANEGRLSQVFLNLILNAAHAIDEGAPERNTVHICTSQEGREVRIAVADTGRGIPREHFDRLFDPFFTTKTRGQGSGLGLSICRDIVQSHAGRIEVTSAPGRGSQFTVFLPIGSSEGVAPAAPSSAMPFLEERARRPRLLVVDDERTLRTTLSALLGDAFEVVLAESGAAAFDVLRADRAFDVILCDLMMPEISGMQVHAWVAREAAELLPRMVFMTGGAFTRNASEFLEQVGSRYIEKPFEVRDLMEVLDRVVRKGMSARPSAG
jgi:PAS domain S-box-containing protein